MRHLRRDERGVTIVEAAFVIPIFFLLAFGLIDMGLWGLQKGQASSAARDGARAGIVLKLAGTSPQAGEATSMANVSAIKNAVAGRLDRDTIENVVVTCEDGLTGVTKTDCSSVVNGRDRIKVVVTWNRPFLTFVGTIFGNSSTVTGTSTMVIAGAPS